MDGGNPIGLTLAIGNLALTLKVWEAGLAALLQERYADFLQSVPSELVIDLRSDGDRKVERRVAPGVEIDLDRLAAFTRRMTIEVDYPGGNGWILLDSTCPTADVEIALRYIFALSAFRAGGFLLHGAGIVHGGSGYLFLGPSGAGKSTVARLSGKDTVLNDDLVYVWKDQTTWIIAGTPFSHRDQIPPTPSRASLKQMYRLVQDQRVYLEPLQLSQSVAEMIANTPVLARSPALAPALLERSNQLLNDVTLERLHFLPDRSFWDLIDTELEDGKYWQAG
jgi:hypothetical protein